MQNKRESMFKLSLSFSVYLILKIVKIVFFNDVDKSEPQERKH